jgi:hypothetical protein
MMALAGELIWSMMRRKVLGRRCDDYDDDDDDDDDNVYDDDEDHHHHQARRQLLHAPLHDGVGGRADLEHDAPEGVGVGDEGADGLGRAVERLALHHLRHALPHRHHVRLRSHLREGTSVRVRVEGEEEDDDDDDVMMMVVVMMIVPMVSMMSGLGGTISATPFRNVTTYVSEPTCERARA